ncbi:MAG: aspartate/glutamate racemase family protein [Candidatus Promineifilaceae bacterium]
MMIGVVAGVGPFAGLDLLKKIATQTVARSDQEHLAVVSISRPSTIPDRTSFLMGETTLNPAAPILEQLRQLEQIGASVAGIPCNTAHAPLIMDVILEELEASGSRLNLLHMVRETGKFLQRHYPSAYRVGLLSTVGTSLSRVYPLSLEPLGFEVVEPAARESKELVHRAIYDGDYGIKAHGYATERARKDLLRIIEDLEAAGAQAVILGCTELPLAFPENEMNGLPIVDSTMALARALIGAVDPLKLRPWPVQPSG